MRIGVPSGVGDTYWALTKLQAFRKRHRVKHLTLCIKSSKLERASGWGKMVDFIDAVEVVDFDSRAAGVLGFSSCSYVRNGVDFVLWPNAVLDRGIRIEHWLPGYKTDLAFPVKTEKSITGANVLYISSVRNKVNCFPKMPDDYWPDVARLLFALSGKPPVIIGAHFDIEFAQSMQWESPVIDLVGQTTLPQVAGIIQHARVMVGIISGMTILANHFRIPTVALCPDKYHKAFPRTWIAKGTPYAIEWARRLPQPADLITKAQALCR